MHIYVSDIDWEYPAGEQAEAFVALLKETHAGLKAHAKNKGDKIPYELNVSGTYSTNRCV
jgi:GH18 family chitinase